MEIFYKNLVGMKNKLKIDYIKIVVKIENENKWKI